VFLVNYPDVLIDFDPVRFELLALVLTFVAGLRLLFW